MNSMDSTGTNVVPFLHNASLSANGFALKFSPTSISNYYNLMTICRNGNLCKEELEKLLKIETDYVDSQKTYYFTLWNPMVRSQQFNSSRRGNEKYTATPSTPVANMVHIDTDIGTYSNIKDIVTLVERNLLDKYSDFPTDEIISLLEKGHRFAIFNFWRNINSNPVSQAP